MLPLYGIIGSLLIMFGELNIFILKIQPFLYWNFNFFWFGYILFIDSVAYKIHGNSLLHKLKISTSLLLLSGAFWWVFEGFNIFIRNWHYINLANYPLWFSIVYKSLPFSTVILAVLSTFFLIYPSKIFDRIKYKVKLKVNKTSLLVLIFLGAVFLVFPIIYPKYTFPLVWIFSFFLIDPINYMNKQPSIIKFFQEGKTGLILSIMLAAFICGFFWEFWNYWSYTKWVYTIPFVTGNFPQLFEMPIVGYFGYLAFGLEVFSLFIFFKFYFLDRFFKSRLNLKFS